jgi:hypothetical protein
MVAVLPMEPAHFRIESFKSVGMRQMNDGICSYILTDVTNRGEVAGVVYLQGTNIIPGRKIDFPYELVVISRCTHPRLAHDPTSVPPLDDSDLSAWARDFNYEEWKKRMDFEKRNNQVKLLYENSETPWGIYDVLVVTVEENLSYRIGVGIVIAEAFHWAKPVKKRIFLR